MNQIEKTLENNWSDVKDKLKRQWNKLTDNDIKQIDGSLEALTNRLKKLYHTDLDKIENEVSDFFSSNKFGETKNKLHVFKKKALEKSEEIKELVKEYMDNYYQQIKNVSVNTEEKLLHYCKSNPIKTAGIAFLTGCAVVALFSKKKTE